MLSLVWLSLNLRGIKVADDFEWHRSHDRKLLCVFPDVKRRRVSFFVALRVSQATLAPSASRAGTCSGGQWRSGQGPSPGRALRKGWWRWAGSGSWHAAVLGGLL